MQWDKLETTVGKNDDSQSVKEEEGAENEVNIWI